MKFTKTVFDGEKFVEISDAERPKFVAAYHAWQEKRAKINDRIMFVQDYAFFVIPALVLFLWFVAHWFGASDSWFGQSYTFLVLPVCVMLLYVAKAWHDARPYRPE
jgi:hypothetical protein